MKVKFLGTSYGAPSKGRHCQSILIETASGDAYLVDAGAPVIDILVNSGYDMKKIKAIFITHMHGDHINGLFDIQYLADVYGMKSKVVLPEQRGIDFMNQYIFLQFGHRNNHAISYELIQKGAFYGDGNLSVEAIPSMHAEVAYGFMLEADNAKIYITGDLSPTLEDFPDILYHESVDLLVTECAHFEAKVLINKIQQSLAKKAALVHIFPPAKYQEFEQLSEDVSFQILLPGDGDEYII